MQRVLLGELYGVYLGGALCLQVLYVCAQLLHLGGVLVRLEPSLDICAVVVCAIIDFVAQVIDERIVIALDHVQRRNHGLNQQLRC